MVPKQPVKILAGAAFTLAVLVPLAGFAYVNSGIYNVGASEPHSEFTEWLTHETMIHSVRSHAKGVKPPSGFSAAEVQRGFCAYETHCVACHGAPAVARERWVSGMEPAPPYILDAARRFKPQELFWIAKNGIKMTGMPAWRNSMSDDQLWDVVAFLEAMPKMNSEEYLRWRSAGFCGPVSGQPSPGSTSIPRP